MKRELSVTDRLIQRNDLVEKWIKDRKKEKSLVRVANIFLYNSIHKEEFHKWMLQGKNEIKICPIVRPDKKLEGKYYLVRGWRAYHQAQVNKQKEIEVYITHTGRAKFAKKLARYEKIQKKKLARHEKKCQNKKVCEDELCSTEKNT